MTKRSIRNMTGDKVNAMNALQQNAAHGTPEFAEAEQVMAQYQGMSEADLMSELMSMRRGGDISDAQLNEFTSKVYPMLNEQMRAKMSRILSMMGK
ncbi:MAG: hypothetical protein Q4B99_05640 [Clostridia bacterium]|nr:hypothetical protein [Clostridia bacterium]